LPPETDCHEEHAALQSRLDAMAAEADAHRKAIKEGQEAIASDISEHVHPEIEELAVHLIGPRLSALEGGGRDRRRGVEGKLNSVDLRLRSMEATLNNGIKTRLTTRDRVLLWTAAIGGAATVTAAIVAVTG
jgi:hypothetical protein